METVRKLMDEAVADGVFPGASLLVGRPDRILYSRAFGRLGLDPPAPATRDTVYDLASLTKPLATTAAVMRLVQDGRLSLSGRLGELCPAFAARDKSGITLAQLLGHASGFPAYRPYYQKLVKQPPGGRMAYLENLLAEEPLEYSPGEATVYSDLGFMVLQMVIRHMAHRRLDVFVHETVYAKLGIDDLFFIPLDGREAGGGAAKTRIAATEICPWRDRVLVGEVHDDNAHLMGGVAGHAGLFGTAYAVWCLVSEMVSAYHGDTQAALFSRKVVREFFTRKEGPGSFVLGFDTPSRPGSSSGDFFSDRSVGHLGFTGTSFWADLERRLIVVLLTNRVHPTRGNEAIRQFRPRLHDAVMESLD